MSDAKYIVTQRIWVQTSSQYDAQERLRTRSVSGGTTVAEIMEWAKADHAFARGDVFITKDA